MLSNIPGLIFVMAPVIFSPLFSGERVAVRRRTLLLLCETAGNMGGCGWVGGTCNHSFFLCEAGVEG